MIVHAYIKIQSIDAAPFVNLKINESVDVFMAVTLVVRWHHFIKNMTPSKHITS